MKHNHLGLIPRQGSLVRQGMILVLSTALVACGSSDNDPDTNNSSSSASEATSDSASSESSSEGNGSVDEPSLVLAINAGAFDAVTFEEVEYQSDQFAKGGTINSAADSEASELFQTERYGSYAYEIPVTEGTYDVELHFVEMYHQEAGERSFNVEVEGELVLSEIDLFNEVGSNQPYSYSVDSIQVNDGHLTIELETLIDNGTLSGFAIHSLDGEFVPPPPPGPGAPGEPGVASDENTGADCPVPAFPAASELPSIATLPDPFMGLDGERVSTLEQWRCHRQETNLQIQEYEAGTKPAKPTEVSGSVTEEAISVSVTHDGETIEYDATITLPSEGEAPYPAIIGVGGSNLNNDYFANQGIAVINFDNNEVGAQAGGDSRGTGLFFDLYGSDHSASSMTAWAWGISRVIDVIAETEDSIIDGSRIGVTGCSRNGKGALMAGALDERIALTIPQESGAGGAVAWRVAESLADGGQEVQTLGHAAGEQPWFRESFGQTFSGNNVTRLPFDHHQLMGMVAPRGLLVIDNSGIDWLGAFPAFVGTSAAKEIYRALEAEDNIAYSENGGHDHCQFPAHQQEILDAFVQRFLLGESGNTNVMTSTTGDEDDVNEWIEWTTPTLE